MRTIRRVKGSRLRMSVALTRGDLSRVTVSVSGGGRRANLALRGDRTRKPTLRIPRRGSLRIRVRGEGLDQLIRLPRPRSA